MAKINIDVDDKNLTTVMTILKNLKSGLIKNINVESKNNEKDRYLSKEKYKQKVQKKVLEDEFLPKSTSTSKYLSPNEFKKRLKGS
ncbi:hypothetical protein [Halarcobacter sp.]|uniref:hypothetical protein n=1 Tax=Halarcobacter sp. TaxID=2321133 RepID=UPI0029F4F0C4|nr:hypothetical protein [Halarcobacter sp.]